MSGKRSLAILLILTVAAASGLPAADAPRAKLAPPIRIEIAADVPIADTTRRTVDIRITPLVPITGGTLRLRPGAAAIALGDPLEHVLPALAAGASQRISTVVDTGAVSEGATIIATVMLETENDPFGFAKRLPVGPQPEPVQPQPRATADDEGPIPEHEMRVPATVRPATP